MGLYNGILKKIAYLFGGYFVGFWVAFAIVLAFQALSTFIFHTEKMNIILIIFFFGILTTLSVFVAIKYWMSNKSFVIGYLLGTIFYTLAACQGMG